MILEFPQLHEVRTQHANEKIVLTSGTFDLFHVGHIAYLNRVKAYGDVVVVMLSGDQRVRSRKGPTRPIIPEADRATILDALKMVDYVVIDNAVAEDSDNPYYAQLMSDLQPDYYVTDGPDPRFWGKLAPEKFIVLDRQPGGHFDSTSAIIDRISRL